MPCLISEPASRQASVQIPVETAKTFVNSLLTFRCTRRATAGCARPRVSSNIRRQMDDWASIEAATGWSIPENVRQGCVGPKVVTIPAGRELYAAGPSNKERMNWGAFEEYDLGWYLQGNQLDPSWYLGNRAVRIALYEYSVVLREPTRAIMSKVAVQVGAPSRVEPFKFQYFTPVGLGKPTRVRLLGYLEVDGRFAPVSDDA